MLRRLIWKWLGYGCCLPVHHHELQGILENYQERSALALQQQLSDQRAQMFEFLKQQEEQKDVLEVRLVK
jgi:hypothetical protein